MKHLFYSIALASITFLSCEKADKLTQFEIEFENEARVPASTGVNLPFNVFMPEQETDSEFLFEVNDTRKDKIEEIFLTDLKLRVTEPNGQDFSFLESIRLYINADGLEETLLAWKEEVPSTNTVISLELTNQDMQEFIKKDQFSLRINVVTDEVLASDHYLLISSKYWVNAKLIGN